MKNCVQDCHSARKNGPPKISGKIKLKNTFAYMRKFKVSYSYPLEHPIKVVIERVGVLGFLGWLMQKYGKKVRAKNLLISERLIELPMLHQWLGRIFPVSSGELLEIGHVAS